MRGRSCARPRPVGEERASSARGAAGRQVDRGVGSAAGSRRPDEAAVEQRIDEGRQEGDARAGS